MSSSVHYKFKSSLETESLFFDGPNISLSDLKKAIIEKKHMAALMGKFDLQIVNMQNREEYKANDLVPKNTLVIVSRIPITKPVKKEPRKDLSTLEPLRIESIPLGPVSLLPTDLANLEVSEDKKIEIMMNQATQDYSHINYTMKPRIPSGPVPRSYICHQCGQMGHFIQNCPNPKNLDPEVGGVPRLKRSTGIPSSFMTAVNDINTPGVLINSSGKLVVPTIDALAYKEGKKEKPPFVKDNKPLIEPESKTIPRELLCPICNDLLKYGVVAPCCGNSACDECIRNKIMESETFSCPICNEKNISPDRLIANVFMRTAVNNYMNERGYITGKPLPAKPLEEVKPEVILPSVEKINIPIQLLTNNISQFSVPPPSYQPTVNYPPSTNIISSATINVYIGTNVFDETQRVIHRMIHPQTVSVADLHNLLAKTGGHRFSPGCQLVRMIVAHPILRSQHQVTVQSGQTIPSIVTSGTPRPVEKEHIKSQANAGNVSPILSSANLQDSNHPKESYSNEYLDSQGKPRRQQSDIFEFAEDIMYKKKQRVISKSSSPRSPTRHRSRSYSRSKESLRRYRSKSRTKKSKSKHSRSRSISRLKLKRSRSRSLVKRSTSRSYLKHSRSRSRSLEKLSRSASKSRHSRSRARGSRSKISRSHSKYRSNSNDLKLYKVAKHRSHSRSPCTRRSPIEDRRKHTPPKQYRSSSLARYRERSIDKIARRRSLSRSYSRRRSTTPYEAKRRYSRSLTRLRRHKSFSRSPYRSRTLVYKSFSRNRSISRKRHRSRSMTPPRKHYEHGLVYGGDVYNFSPTKIGLQYHGYDESDPRWIEYLKLYKQWYDKYGERLGYPSKPPGLEHIDYKKIMSVSTLTNRDMERRMSSSKRKDSKYNGKHAHAHPSHSAKEDHKTSTFKKSKSKGKISPAKKRITQLDDPVKKEKKETHKNSKSHKESRIREDSKVHKDESKSHEVKFNKESIKPHKQDILKHHRDDIKHSKEDIKPHKEDIKRKKEDIKPHKEDIKRSKEDIKRHKEDIKPYKDNKPQEDNASHKEDNKLQEVKPIKEEIKHHKSSNNLDEKIIEANLKDVKSNKESKIHEEIKPSVGSGNLADKTIEVGLKDAKLLKEGRNNEDISRSKSGNMAEKIIEANCSDLKKLKDLSKSKEAKYKDNKDDVRNSSKDVVHDTSRPLPDGKIQSKCDKTSKDKALLMDNLNTKGTTDTTVTSKKYASGKEMSGDKDINIKSKDKENSEIESAYKSSTSKEQSSVKGSICDQLVVSDKNASQRTLKAEKRLRDESEDSKASNLSKKSGEIKKQKHDYKGDLVDPKTNKIASDSSLLKIKNLVDYGDSSDDKERIIKDEKDGKLMSTDKTSKSFIGTENRRDSVQEKVKKNDNCSEKAQKSKNECLNKKVYKSETRVEKIDSKLNTLITNTESAKNSKTYNKKSSDDSRSEEIKSNLKRSDSDNSKSDKKPGTESRKLKSTIATLPSAASKTSESNRESTHHKHKHHKHKSYESPKHQKLMSQVTRPKNILDQDNNYSFDDDVGDEDTKHKKKKHKHSKDERADESHKKHKSKKNKQDDSP